MKGEKALFSPFRRRKERFDVATAQRKVSVRCKKWRDRLRTRSTCLPALPALNALKSDEEVGGGRGGSWRR
jgi:hypothetical protein